MPRRLGERAIMATFSADEITEIDGMVKVEVISKSVWEETEKEEKMEKEENMETEAAVDETDGGAVAETGSGEGAVVKPVAPGVETAAPAPAVEANGDQSGGVVDGAGDGAPAGGATTPVVNTTSAEPMENGAA